MTPEREAEIRQRAAFAAECAVEGVGGPLDTIERERAQLLSELDAVRAERDTLAAALAELREKAAWYLAERAAWVAVDGQPIDGQANRLRAAHDDLERAISSLPADLAAERFRRERAEALEAAADAMYLGSGLVASPASIAWLRARAADERGGR